MQVQDYTQTAEYKAYMFKKEQKAKMEWLKSINETTNVEWSPEKYKMIRAARTR